MKRLSAEALAGQSPQRSTSTQTDFTLMAYPFFFAIEIKVVLRPGVQKSQDWRFL